MRKLNIGCGWYPRGEIKVAEIYHVTLRKGEDGLYVVQCIEIPEAISQQDSEEARLYSFEATDWSLSRVMNR